jgi:hypothetical protein
VRQVGHFLRLLLRKLLQISRFSRLELLILPNPFLRRVGSRVPTFRRDVLPPVSRALFQVDAKVFEMRKFIDYLIYTRLKTFPEIR